MTISSAHLSSEIEYPDTDGLPMAESDFQRQYLSYAVEVLRIYFKTMLMCMCLGISSSTTNKAIPKW